MGIFSRNKSSDRPRELVVEEGWPSRAVNGFVVLDLETTGLSPRSDRIIEIAMIRTDNYGIPLGYWSSLVNPKRAVSATEIHGIRDSDVSDAPTFDAIADDVFAKLTGQVLVAHNAKFDLSFLQEEFARTGWEIPALPVVCTMIESKSFIPGLSSRRLSDCVEATGLRGNVQHRALGDATLAAALLRYYVGGSTNERRANELVALTRSAAAVTWPHGKTYPANTSPSAVSGQSRAPQAPSDIMKRAGEMMPEDLLGDIAPVEELTYCQLLLEVISDGSIDPHELVALSECAQSFSLSSDSVTQIHENLLLALARNAWSDGVVSQAEQRDILNCAASLGLPEVFGRRALSEIDEMRQARVAARVRDLPTDWKLGEPLRIGDRVVITGCYDSGRYELEKRARMLGVRITGGVSGRTNLLVSDGSINGNKDEDARRLGVRVVGPDEFRTLLDYVQAAENVESDTSTKKTGSKVSGGSSITEELTCTQCAMVFTRVVSRGRKPLLCPDCRA